MALFWMSAFTLSLGHDCMAIARLATLTKTADEDCHCPLASDGLKAVPRGFHRCEADSGMRATLMAYLALSKLLGLVQWLLVAALAPDFTGGLLFNVYLKRLVSLQSLTPFIRDRQIAASIFIILFVFYSVSGPVWATRISCSAAGYNIIMLCMLSGFLTSLLSAHLGASEYETSLVFVPCSVSIGASLGLLCNHQPSAYPIFWEPQPKHWLQY